MFTKLVIIILRSTQSFWISLILLIFMPQASCGAIHDDVIKWKHFPRYWPFVRGIHRPPVNIPPKGQWRGALMFSFICAWTNTWASKQYVGDLRRYRAHYDVTVMELRPQVVITLTTFDSWSSAAFYFHLPNKPQQLQWTTKYMNIHFRY